MLEPSSPEISRQKKDKHPEKNHRRRTLLWVTLSLLALGVLFLLAWLFYFQFHESTDDAYANGNMINVTSAVPGSVVAFYADDTDLVTEGQLIIELDHTDYQVRFEQELATLAATVLDVRQLFDNVQVNKANVESKRIAEQRARYDYENRLGLIDSLAVSGEDFTHAKDTYETAQADLKYAQYQLEMALAAAGNTSIEKHPLIEEQKNAVRRAYYQLQHCAIYAPYTGYVAQRTVEVGEWVTAGQNLLAVIPVTGVWVDANYKETQLRHMRIGQPAVVWFDLYGSGVKFEGKVLGIASGTGSVFSIIPPQNATGNWIKIVQRLPVRISLDPEQVLKFPTRLGISAEVRVNTTDRDLPMLAPEPTVRTVASTGVFDFDFTSVNQEIEQIIQKNLKDSK